MEGGERWSRGVSVLGTSGHINEYKPGVNINNFVEEIAGADMRATGQHVLGFGAPFTAESTQRRSYNPYGKTGADLIQASERQDQRLSTQGLGADMLTRHGRFDHPQQQFFASLNELTYGPDRHHGEPKVQTYTWSPSNTHNYKVPLNTTNQSLTATRKAQWDAEANRDAFSTTSRSGQLSAALDSSLQPPKTGTLRPGTDGAGCTVGRKPKGVHNDEVDKTYRRTGLRDVYYRGNIS